MVITQRLSVNKYQALSEGLAIFKYVNCRLPVKKSTNKYVVRRIKSVGVILELPFSRQIKKIKGIV